MRIVKIVRPDDSFSLKFAWGGEGGVDYLPAGGGSVLFEPGDQGRTADESNRAAGRQIL